MRANSSKSGLKILLGAILLVGALVCAFFISTREGETDAMSEIDKEIQDGDYRGAMQLIDKLNDKSLAGMKVYEMAHMSLICMQMAELNDDPVLVEKAAMCYRAAMARDSVATTAYYADSTAGNERLVMMLANIVGTLDNPDKDLYLDFDSIPDFEEPDIH